MKSQVSPVLIGLAAQLARIGFLPGMCEHMSLEMVRLCVRSRTHLTDVRFFARMYARVLREAVLVHERLPTRLTDVRFFTSMNAIVLVELRLLDKTLFAHAADVRFVSRVQLLVELQRDDGCETAATEVAEERPLGIEPSQAILLIVLGRLRLVHSLKVLSEVRLSVVRQLAHGALVGLCLVVDDHVVEKRRLLDEALAAEVAEVRPNTRVHLDVPLEIRLVREALVTVRADMWLLTGVDQ